MENIGRFLDSCYHYGLEKNDVFQTVDLYDNTNIPQVGLYDCSDILHTSFQKQILASVVIHMPSSSLRFSRDKTAKVDCL